MVYCNIFELHEQNNRGTVISSPSAQHSSWPTELWQGQLLSFLIGIGNSYGSLPVSPLSFLSHPSIMTRTLCGRVSKLVSQSVWSCEGLIRETCADVILNFHTVLLNGRSKTFAFLFFSFPSFSWTVVKENCAKSRNKENTSWIEEQQGRRILSPRH